MKSILRDALLAASVSVAVANAPAFTLDDIHFWVGSGAKRAAVVIDWSRDGQPSLAWGYRWDGDATLADALLAIGREDPRLTLLTADSDYYGLDFYAAGYDLGDSGAVFTLDYNGGYVVAESSDPGALVAGGWLTNGYWSQRDGAIGNAYDATTLVDGWGASLTDLADGGWHVFQFASLDWVWGAYPTPAAPAAASSPYGYEIVASTYETDTGFNSWPRASAALGAPARWVAGTSYSPAGPVSPVNPASDADTIVSLVHGYDWDTYEEIPGSITIRFDHPVVDDPLNPYGLDFIVFGNAMQVAQGYYTATSNPAATTVKTSSLVAEPGLVEVSQNGSVWYAFNDGPYADDWAPTLAYTYDPAHADTKLFAENRWWGAPTDATRPLDPALTAASFKGLTLARIAQLYEGSAGGTGFDIGRFRLPVDAKGRKWIQYVRVTSLTTSDDADWTEVDAVADVAPCTSSYVAWLRANYAAADRVDGNGTDRLDVSPNGRTNAENAALGLGKAEASDVEFRISGFSVANGVMRFTVPGAPCVQDIVKIASAPKLGAKSWAKKRPTYRGLDSHGDNVFELQMDEKADAAFFKLVIE